MHSERAHHRTSPPAILRRGGFRARERVLCALCVCVHACALYMRRLQPAITTQIHLKRRPGRFVHVAVAFAGARTEESRAGPAGGECVRSMARANRTLEIAHEMRAHARTHRHNINGFIIGVLITK